MLIKTKAVKEFSVSVRKSVHELADLAGVSIDEPVKIDHEKAWTINLLLGLIRDSIIQEGSCRAEDAAVRAFFDKVESVGMILEGPMPDDKDFS